VLSLVMFNILIKCCYGARLMPPVFDRCVCCLFLSLLVVHSVRCLFRFPSWIVYALSVVSPCSSVGCSFVLFVSAPCSSVDCSVLFVRSSLTCSRPTSCLVFLDHTCHDLVCPHSLSLLCLYSSATTKNYRPHRVLAAVSVFRGFPRTGSAFDAR